MITFSNVCSEMVSVKLTSFVPSDRLWRTSRSLLSTSSGQPYPLVISLYEISSVASSRIGYSNSCGSLSMVILLCNCSDRCVCVTTWHRQDYSVVAAGKLGGCFQVQVERLLESSGCSLAQTLIFSPLLIVTTYVQSTLCKLWMLRVCTARCQRANVIVTQISACTSFSPVTMIRFLPTALPT